MTERSTSMPSLIEVTRDGAGFGIPEVRLGILPAVISPYVIRRLGDRNAREYMLTGERFDAATAARIGLISHTVPVGGLDAKVEERVHQLLAGSPAAQRRVKTRLELWADSAWEEYRAALPPTLSKGRSGAAAKDCL